MGNPQTFLGGIYEKDTLEAASNHYAEFADRYDSEMTENGYITPKRCATVLAKYVEDRTPPVLDLGCGSGLSGLALRAVGFETLDGVDYSEPMLEQARRKGIYRTLSSGDLAQLSADGAHYSAMMAAGVLNPAHAPAEALDAIIDAIDTGGILVFSLNDHAVSDGSYVGRINMMVDCGLADLLYREYGEHMPGIGLKSWVYALRKR